MFKCDAWNQKFFLSFFDPKIVDSDIFDISRRFYAYEFSIKMSLKL